MVSEPWMWVRTAGLRGSALPASFLVGLALAAASCAADLDDPDAYTVARNQGTGVGGSPPATGGTVGTTGGTTPGTGGTSTAGGTSGGMTGGANPPLAACAKTIFTSCAVCHSKSVIAFPEVGAGLDLSGDDVATRLVGIAARNAEATDKAGCGPLINATTPTESVLLKRIRGAGPCGPVMPEPSGLTTTEKKCLEDWVALF